MKKASNPTSGASTTDSGSCGASGRCSRKSLGRRNGDGELTASRVPAGRLGTITPSYCGVGPAQTIDRPQAALTAGTEDRSEQEETESRRAAIAMLTRDRAQSAQSLRAEVSRGPESPRVMTRSERAARDGGPSAPCDPSGPWPNVPLHARRRGRNTSLALCAVRCSPQYGARRSASPQLIDVEERTSGAAIALGTPGVASPATSDGAGRALEGLVSPEACTRACIPPGQIDSPASSSRGRGGSRAAALCSHPKSRSTLLPLAAGSPRGPGAQPLPHGPRRNRAHAAAQSQPRAVGERR
jgi:hypothetical protein